MEPGLWKLMRRRDKREGSPKSTPGTDTANQQINLTSLKKKKTYFWIGPIKKESGSCLQGDGTGGGWWWWGGRGMRQDGTLCLTPSLPYAHWKRLPSSPSPLRTSYVGYL